jgi:hypothetical protein
VDPKFPNPNGKNDTSIIIYGYTPSVELAAFAAAWFFIQMIAHTAQNFTRRSWWWMVFSTGLIFEIIGYIARSLSAEKDPYNLIYFVLQYFFIVTAPVFLAAGIYTILSALISRLGNEYSFLKPKVILGFFVTSDAVSTIIQIAGACLVFAMSIFVILMASFQYRARHVIKKHGYILFCVAFSVATILVYLRTIFRLAETAEGLGGKLSTREVFFACLEFAPIALVVHLLAIFHPGRCLGARVRVRDEKVNMHSDLSTSAAHFNA